MSASFSNRAPPRRSLLSGALPSPPAPLQHLLQMGFPRHRAVKALAATGNKSVQLASDWLLTHVNDSTLDEDIPREYIVYACPTGPLFEQLKEFWEKSKELCGWNGAHNFTPHITLVSFFKAPDECSLHLSKVLKSVVEVVGQPPDNILKLEPYISPNFIGLFVSNEHVDYLKNIAVQYVKEVSSSIGLTMDTYEQLDALATCFPWCAMSQEPPQPSICLEPHVKSLHITLAYQFPTSSYSTLKELAESLQPLEKGYWELRLYSRDPRLSTHHVYMVKHEYASRECDELELRHGDYIYINENSVQNLQDEWIQGISWLTGLTGYLPITYTERTAESDAWTLHKALSLGDHNVHDFTPTSAIGSNESLPYVLNDNQNEVNDNQYLETKYLEIDADDGQNSVVENISTEENSEYNNAKQTKGLLVMRHGERVDFTYGSWISYCFDEHDKYIRKDLNMPQELPQRIGGSSAYASDCPLTMVGLLQARLVGEGLKSAGVTLSHIYSSPSYRCVQSAQAVLEGLEATEYLKIKIEPSLFEWLMWYPKGLPMWMTTEEFVNANLDIDTEYEPYMKVGEMPFIPTSKDSECFEDCYQFYQRNANFILHAIENSNNEDGMIMFVGHASTLDTAWRGVANLSPRDATSLGKLMQNVPYCSLITIKGPPWHLIPPPCPPFMNTSNKRFDWKIIQDD